MGAEKLVGLIKQVIKEYIQNENMTDLVYATYTGTALKVDSMQVEVPIDMVDIPPHLREIKGEISFTVTNTDRNADGQLILSASPAIDNITINKMPVVLKTGLLPGDRVAAVQKRGGQKYAIIAKG